MNTCMQSSSSSSSASRVCTLTVAVTLVGSVVAVYWHLHHHRQRQTIEYLQQQRQEERTGRIRAETKLRSVLKKQQQQQFDKTTQDNNKHCMIVHSIGTVISPYTKRMGTPRQAQCVVSSRGILQLQAGSQFLLDGIQEYNYIWILFEFHANTNITATSKAKIRPPRAPHKVGQLATRSPHRPNPIGLSLCQLYMYDSVKNQLHVRGIDLVHGTPILDIKPYVVPWDMPLLNSTVKMPEWVQERNDELLSVSFSEMALLELSSAVADGHLAPLYTDDNDGCEGARATIYEILQNDIRSRHNNVGAHYNFVFCNVQVQFRILDKVVLVNTVRPTAFDESQYVDGIPLVGGGTK